MSFQSDQSWAREWIANGARIGEWDYHLDGAANNFLPPKRRANWRNIQWPECFWLNPPPPHDACYRAVRRFINGGYW